MTNSPGTGTSLDLLRTKSRIWEYESEWRSCIAGDQQRHSKIAHPVSVCLGPRCSTENMRRVRDALPSTVRDFDIVIPQISDGQLCYATCEVDDIVRTFGGIPSLEQIFEG